MSRVHLGDVAIEHKETCKEDKSMYPIVGLEHLTPEQITLQNWDLNTENTFTKIFRKGNILFGRRRAYLKKAAVAPFDGICSGDITVIEAKEDKIIPELLPFVIQNDDLFDFAVGKSAGSLSPRVKWTHLQNYEFELPDKQKQHELAKVLWAIEDTRKSYQQLIKKTDELVKSQFIELLDKGNYKKKKIKELYDLQMGRTPARDNKLYWDNDDYRWISIADLNSYGTYTENTKEYISQKAVNETGIKVVPRNTVIMSFKLTIGKTAITSEDIYTNEAIMAFLPKQEYIITEFLNIYLSNKDWSDDSNRAVKGVTLNKSSLGNVELFIPPIDVQTEFVLFAQQSDKSKFGKEMCDKWILEIKNLCCQMYLTLRQ